jgi:hypothetical protein
VQDNIESYDILPVTTNTYTIGNSTHIYTDIYATNIHGNATTATTASSTTGVLALQLNSVALGNSFNGSTDITWNIPIFNSATNSTAGSVGLVPAPQAGS